MKNTLTQLRQQIDSIDQEIKELIKKRSYIIDDVIKVKHNQPVKTRFARELLQSAKILQEDYGNYNPIFIHQIWRYLITATLEYECNGLKAGIYCQDANVAPLVYNTLTNYFSTFIDIIQFSNIKDMIKSINHYHTEMCAINALDIEIIDILLKYQSIKINAKLPFFKNKYTRDCQVFILGKAKIEPSINDVSCFIIENQEINKVSNYQILLQNDDYTLINIPGLHFQLSTTNGLFAGAYGNIDKQY